jgi:hypothetical protein
VFCNFGFKISTLIKFPGTIRIKKLIVTEKQMYNGKYDFDFTCVGLAMVRGAMSQ